MRAIMRVLRNCLLVIAVAGCGSTNAGVKPTYKAAGILQSVQKSEGVVEGVRSEYVFKLVNIEPGSNPDPQDVQQMFLAITKNTEIMDSEKNSVEVAALKPGSRFEVTWRWANDHLPEAMEIVRSDNAKQ